MGFTDLLTSSRGPGVIGTLLALLVLVGFGTLYMFVFDEGLQGGKKTIEAVVRDQALDIEAHKVQIANTEKRIEESARFKIQAKEADDLKTRAEISAARIAELVSAKAAAESAIIAANEAWENYKDEYRASEWAAAKGEKLEDIKTATGETYTNVVISEVDHTGMRISHSAGSKTIAPKDLPADIHDRFQFTEEKTTKVREQIDADFADLTGNVEIATLAKNATEKLLKCKQLEEEVQAANAKIQAAKLEGPRQQASIAKMRAAVSAERSKKGGISNAPQMQQQLRAMETAAKATRDSIAANERKVRDGKRDIANLEREVAQMRIDIARLKKEAAAKQAPVPQR